jgi:hypothetical protein
MPSKDFSAPQAGRRLRFTLGVYHPATKQFRHVRGISARVTVRNAKEQAELWKAIERTIAAGDWRLPDGNPELATPAGPADADSGRAAVGS